MGVALRTIQFEVDSECLLPLFATCIVSVLLTNLARETKQSIKPSDAVLVTTICLVNCLANFGVI